MPVSPTWELLGEPFVFVKEAYYPKLVPDEACC
jgi:hypothetical protein